MKESVETISEMKAEIEEWSEELKNMIELSNEIAEIEHKCDDQHPFDLYRVQSQLDCLDCDLIRGLLSLFAFLFLFFCF